MLISLIIISRLINTIKRVDCWRKTATDIRTTSRARVIDSKRRTMPTRTRTMCQSRVRVRTSTRYRHSARNESSGRLEVAKLTKITHKKPQLLQQRPQLQIRLRLNWPCWVMRRERSSRQLAARPSRWRIWLWWARPLRCAPPSCSVVFDRSRSSRVTRKASRSVSKNSKLIFNFKTNLLFSELELLFFVWIFLYRFICSLLF